MGKEEKATFAGGCFWCMQPPYDTVKGVLRTTVGYCNGSVKNPTYEQVCEGTTGHAEAVEIVFDPEIVSYDQLLDVFWKNIDPTTLNRQFADAGTQYRTAIFYHNAEQKKLAEASREKWDKSGKFRARIVTEISPAAEFYPAEEYHQRYCDKNTAHYKMYRYGSGRAAYLHGMWGDEEK